MTANMNALDTETFLYKEGSDDIKTSEIELLNKLLMDHDGDLYESSVDGDELDLIDSDDDTESTALITDSGGSSRNGEGPERTGTDDEIVSAVAGDHVVFPLESVSLKNGNLPANEINRKSKQRCKQNEGDNCGGVNTSTNSNCLNNCANNDQQKQKKGKGSKHWSSNKQNESKNQPNDGSEALSIAGGNQKKKEKVPNGNNCRGQLDNTHNSIMNEDDAATVDCPVLEAVEEILDVQEVASGAEVHIQSNGLNNDEKGRGNIHGRGGGNNRINKGNKGGGSNQNNQGNGGGNKQSNQHKAEMNNQSQGRGGLYILNSGGGNNQNQNNNGGGSDQNQNNKGGNNQNQKNKGGGNDQNQNKGGGGNDQNQNKQGKKSCDGGGGSSGIVSLGGNVDIFRNIKNLLLGPTKKFSHHPLDSFVLWFHYRLGFSLFLIGFHFVWGNWFLRTPIYCTGGYNAESAPKLDHLNICLSYPYVGNFQDPLQQRHILFYRWVHWTFLICAAICYLPRALMKKMENPRIRKFLEDLSANEHRYDEDTDNRNVQTVIVFLQKNLNCHFSMYAGRIICHAVALVLDMCIALFFDFVLQERFLSMMFSAYPYQRNIIGFDDYLSQTFPPFTNCSLTPGFVTITQQRTEHFGCHLTLMELYEKVFILIWLYLFIGVMMSAFSLLIHLLMVFAPFNRLFLHTQKNNRMLHVTKSSVCNICDCGDMYLLYLVKMKVSYFVFCEVLQNIVDNFPNDAFGFQKVSNGYQLSKSGVGTPMNEAESTALVVGDQVRYRGQSSSILPNVQRWGCLPSAPPIGFVCIDEVAKMV